ncbi:MAG: UbiA prenyltransferase family protein [Candidatus Geothermincolales bacterium]
MVERREQKGVPNRLVRAIRKYYILLRPRTMVIFLFPMTLGFASAAEGGGELEVYRLVLAYIAFTLGFLFISALNFYADVESDRLHNDLYKGGPHMSDQPFVTGEMGKVETFLLFLLSAGGCVGIALLVNRPFAFFLGLGMFVIGVLYSHPWFRFKAKPVLDAVTNASSACLFLVAGWKSALPGSWPPPWPMVFGFFFSATLYLPSVANDVPFDRAAGFRTSGVVFGAKRLLDAMIPLCALLLPLAVVNLLVSQSWLFKLFIAMAWPGAVIFTWAMHYLYDPPFIRFNAALMIYPLLALHVLFGSLGIKYILD